MTVALRPETPADRGLLESLLADARAAELACLPDASMRQAFVRQQVEVRERGWRQAWPNADRLVIVAGGEAVGRLLVDVGKDAVHVVDLALRPDHRGQGTGTVILGQVLAQADERGLPCTLTVDEGSPARRLYARLGFVETDADGLRCRMRRAPTGRQAMAAS